MTPDEIVRKLEPWRAKHRRPAWKPVVKSGDGPADASKFSGTPWIGPGAPWPDCGNCNGPLQLFLQLNPGTLPKELGLRFGPGLLQLFYCIEDDCEGEGGWEPFADDLSRVRIVQPAGPGTKSDVPKRKGYYPTRQITGWKAMEDLPGPEEHDGLGLKIDYDFNFGTVDVTCPEVGLAAKGVVDEDEDLAERIANAEPGDKLAGWPHWIQGAEYPACPKCSAAMTLLFQVDSEDNVPFMFGDAGCGHVTQCPTHKEVVAFGWACC